LWVYKTLALSQFQIKMNYYPIFLDSTMTRKTSFHPQFALLFAILS
jgi:hypothetical protein